MTQPPAQPTEQPPAGPPAQPTQQPAPPSVKPPAASVIPPGATVAGQQPAGQVPTWYADGPEAAQAYVDRVVREAASHRVAKNELEQSMQAAIAEAVAKATGEQAQSIGKALGLIQEEEPPVTPERLTELTAGFAQKEAEYQAKIRDLTISSHLNEALANAGAAPFARDALVGSGALNGLDPAADDFAAQLQAKVTGYIEKYPQLKVNPVQPLPQAGASVGDFTGATPPPPGGEKSVDELRAERAKRRAG